MESVLYIQQVSKPGKSIRKGQIINVVSARLIKDYLVEITFNDGHVQVIDFLPVFTKYARGYYSRWLKPSLFKKFMVDGDNLVWGKNWDMIFPVDQLYRGKIK